MSKTIITASAEETAAVGRELAQMVASGGVICLYGDLGSGKTTLTQGLADKLGVTKHVTSPTFLIVRSYTLSPMTENPAEQLYHLDLYRLDQEQEIEDIGIREMVDQTKNIVVIEWSEKLGSLLPQERIDVRMTYISEHERRISIDDHR